MFSEQNAGAGDWPQWFMLDPYPTIRPGDSHGDVIVWPLKALCDYVEATDDLTLLDEVLPWRDDKTRAHTKETAPLSAHVDQLLATVRRQFIPGTSLIRYGEGDWNDSLQPADPHLRDWMVSSWTVALLYEQVVRYAGVQQRARKTSQADDLKALAAAMKADFHRHLIRDNVVAGYGLFSPQGEAIEHLLHPSDTRTGLSYSLIPMTQAIIAGLFTDEEAEHHLAVIAEHLDLPDGAHLMDKPVRYTGGRETLFRRAESAAYFGREIGLMYVHAHLRYAETLALTGKADAFWRALALINPIAVTEHLPQATLRQRNTYFSSSDAAFPDRYAASAGWDELRAGQVPVDGGWRIYSSGPGLYVRALVRFLAGVRRHYGERSVTPTAPAALSGLALTMTVDGEERSYRA